MRSRVLAAILLSATVLAPVAALSNHRTFDSPQECMQSLSVMEGGPPTCTRSGNGPWHASHPRDPGAEARNIFGTFVVIWLLLVGGSVWWVVSTAREHGDPMGTALLGALVGGPLFVLMYGSNSDLIRRSRKLYRWTDQLPDQPTTPSSTQKSSDRASRLRELTRLRDEHLITDDEYSSRRGAILDEV